jgi:hypothetical protein
MENKTDPKIVGNIIRASYAIVEEDNIQKKTQASISADLHHYLEGVLKNAH